MNMIFKVVFKQDDQLIVKQFDTLELASELAESLINQTRFIDVEFSSKGYIHSGSLFKWSRIDNEMSTCNQYMVNQVIKHSLYKGE